MRRLAKLTLLLLSLVFLGLQFVSTTAAPITPARSEIRMAEVIDPQVGAILDRSCQDCHSNRTNWPWYSHIAPASWIVAKDVGEGRQMLDFSSWADQPPSEGDRMYICNAVSTGIMPLPSYTMIHRQAKLSKQDVTLICDWAAASPH